MAPVEDASEPVEPDVIAPEAAGAEVEELTEALLSEAGGVPVFICEPAVIESWVVAGAAAGAAAEDWS